LKEELYNQIERYVSGVSDEEERKRVESLFLQGEEKLYFRDRLSRDWDLSLKEDSSVDIDLNQILYRIHSIILKNEDLKRRRSWNKLIHMYMKVAAIILFPILLTVGGIYSYKSYMEQSVNSQYAVSTIYAPMGSRVSFNLPDGTTGMLNSGSKLSYSLPFARNRRIMFEGEAWFEVKHDAKHPFEISVAETTEIKVLGTSFNLSAYKSDKYVEVVLNDGKIEFQDKSCNKKILLSPSEKLLFQNNSANISTVDPAKYKAWTEGKLVFRNDPMSEVVRRIERWYNVEINLDNSDLDKYTFHATFENDNLEDVLKFMAMISPITYKISPGMMKTDGTFQKETVLIYKKTD